MCLEQTEQEDTFCEIIKKEKNTMGMTMTQKILAAHAGLDSVVSGQLIKAKVDMVLANDITGPVSINEFNNAGFEKVLIRARFLLSWITSFLTRTLNQQSNA